MKRRNTIYHKLIALVLTVALPLTSLLVSNFFYSIYQVRDKIIESNQSAVTFYTQQLDSTLNNTTKYLLTLSTTNENFANVNHSNLNYRFLAYYRLKTELQNHLSLYNVDYFFLYTPRYSEFSYVYDPAKLNYKTSKDIKNSLCSIYFEQDSSYKWKMINIDGRDYLIFAYRTKNYYIGALLKTDTLVSYLESLKNDEQYSFYITDQGGNSDQYKDYLKDQNLQLIPIHKKYYMTGTKKQFITISQCSGTGSFILWELIPNRNVLGLLDQKQIFIFLLTMFVLLILPVTMYLIFHWILTPLRFLLIGIRELEGGNLDYRIKADKVSVEFDEVNQAFNSMSAQITHLQIQVYEEMIDKQRAELNFLQMQMKPHFFLNALTTVSNYAHLGQMDNMYQFLAYFSEHTRYMFQKSISTVSVCEEIHHIENYISMQNLQYKGNIVLFTYVENDLDDFFIPCFALSTPVENCIKHGMAPGRPLTILINVKAIMINGTKKVKITIEDDGKGFTEEYLIHFSNPGFADSNNPKHLGIRNVLKTIQLIYGNEASLNLSNSELNGGKVTILIPLHNNSISKI
ncbi:two-component system, sensor histidine kinase YesM [Anaerocolumna jejuensis DSM 15929]|uniref:Two-component system, sensor histidine kinase YesM n=1 Tax=Anaerocolumna jejuensis DSM 15929 TaxID=1121322 RepID=A0A1M6QMV2_9FIRM|nr:histidine kinase [Anaerocolumna jejuensis]SHK21357.1 two-component system, sensor histidine kinase YesM [Anaerocolumna jejuensis DSM 15929]